jgi:hypothetical protein
MLLAWCETPMNTVYITSALSCMMFEDKSKARDEICAHCQRSTPMVMDQKLSQVDGL